MILITGGAGYIGSHCVLNLIQNGLDVVIFDNLETGHLETVETLQKIAAKGKVVDFIKGDLKNSEEIDAVFKKHKIDVVVHFAAYSQVGESVKNPEKYFQNNVLGSKNLFKAMVLHKVDKLVFSSTAAIYGEPEYVPIDEKHPKKPINPYGETKLAVEKILDDYDKNHNLKSVRLRYFNVVGADLGSRIGEWHEIETHLVPNILKATFGSGKIFEMYGDDYETKDGTCVRDYIDVLDLVQAHKLALDYLFSGGKTEVFNLGTNHGNSVKEVFDFCEKIICKKILIEQKSRRDGDPATLVADNQKALKVLKWSPTRNLEDSIKTAYFWEKILQSQSLAHNIED